MFLSENHDKYSMQLANGQAWCIVATKEVRDWGKKFASLMDLKECGENDHPKLIFVDNALNKEWSTLTDLPKETWRPRRIEKLQMWIHHESADIICQVGESIDHILDVTRIRQTLQPVYEYAQRSYGLPVHAALVEREGIGVLLAARGYTGKSTCCNRIPKPWKALCDDEVLIVRDSKKEYFAHPFPTWSESIIENSNKTWSIQESVPLKAVFFIKQSKTDKAVLLGQAEAAASITRSSDEVWRRTCRGLAREEQGIIKKDIFNSACELAKTIPAYTLHTSLTGKFWEKIEEVLGDV
jgi:SynChlorMet cassette protein ScmC